MSTSSEKSVNPGSVPLEVQVAFGRFRVMAFLTGAVLAFLTLVALPYKYALHGTGTWTMYGWMAHGWLYIVYVLVSLDLSLKAKVGTKQLIIMALAGTIPFMSFVVERKLRKQYRPTA